MISKAIHACQGSNKHGIQYTNHETIKDESSKQKHHKHPYDHNAYACALDLGHT